MFLCIMDIFYSQQGEDVFIYRNFINKKTTDGIFVELGAMNGLTYSNTKFFEDTLGFTGVLIEPTEQYHELVKNRPNCICHNVAVNDKTELVKFVGNYATAGLVNTMSNSFREFWHRGAHEYYVTGEPICNILQKSNIKYIDFLSIDVEGGELVVLQTLDFSVPIYVVCIELDGHNPEKDEKCRTILAKNGFAYKTRFSINEFWTNDKYFRKDILYDSNKGCVKIQKSIFEIGSFPFLEKHIAKTVEDVLILWQKDI
jgi:FkbM family methyltransferase